MLAAPASEPPPASSTSSLLVRSRLTWGTCHAGSACPGDTEVSAANEAGTQGFPGILFVFPFCSAPRYSPR